MKQFLINLSVTTIILLFLISAIPQLNAQQLCPGEKGKLQWKIWRNIDENNWEALETDRRYPNDPDQILPLFRLNSDRNFDDRYAFTIEGFIHVEVSDSVIFNITANDKGRFYLSTDWSPENAEMIAFTNQATGHQEHDINTNQTSDSIYLKAGVDYYFKLEGIDYGWSDHAYIYWKTHNVDKDNWNVVSGKFLRGIACLPDTCPSAGTPCDDGNANTIDDIADGNCNCMGTPVTNDPCIGERHLITHYEYQDIPGSTLNDLYDAPKFPGTPDYSFAMHELGRVYDNKNNYGTLTQGYLTVPTTGDYFFNITSDDRSKFFLSSDADPINKEAHTVEVTGWTSRYQHSKYPEQTSGNITLQAGQLYYFEVNHKQSSGGAGYQVYWRTPNQPDQWKRISKLYVYDYACEIACIPENTPCDDNNPFTNNDQYNASCECEGTPCSGPDCDDPLAYYTPFEKCALSDNIDNREDNNWKSCSPSQSPNSSRGVNHWIQLDLGERYILLNSHIWNYNVPGSTQEGYQMVAVDYSLDGVNWNELGTYNWNLAPGSSQYAGFIGPNFSNVYARYVLFTSLDGTSGCRGIGKVAINAVLCPNQGTACDDNDPMTINDEYDSNCNCAGEPIAENYCEEVTINLGNQILQTESYKAEQTITSISDLAKGSSVGFTAGSSITLDPGFNSDSTTLFVALISPCVAPSIVEHTPRELTREDTIGLVKSENNFLNVLYEPDQEYAVIEYYITKPGYVKLNLVGLDEKYIISDFEHINAGLYLKKIRVNKLSEENYKAVLSLSDEELIKEFKN